MNNIITILNKIEKPKDKLTLKIFIKYISEKNLKKYLTKKTSKNGIITFLEQIVKMMNKHVWLSTHTLFINNITQNIIHQNDWEEYYFKTIFDDSKYNVFTKFLKERNLYDKFNIYIQQHPLYGNRRLNLQNYIYQTTIFSLIIESFSWNRTEEGHEYWSNISVEWEKYVKQQLEKVTNKLMKT